MAKKITFLAIAALFVAVLAMPHNAGALTLKPTSREVLLTPGEKTVTSVDLENETQKEIKLTTQVVNFTAKNETGEPAFDFTATPTDIATWTSPESGPFTLTPGQKQSVLVTFNTPATATPGGHYVAVFFNEVPSTDTSKVNIESKLGALFLATVKGTYVSSGEVANFTTLNNKAYFDKGPISFVLRYNNTGDVHLKPTGSLVIKNMWGKTVKTITVNTELGATLPNTIREYSVGGWNNVGNGYGQYTATLTLKSGTVENTKTIHFWFFSGMSMIIFIVVAIILILLAVMLLKRSHGAPSVPPVAPKK
ncbi:MAG: hypothetical protein WCT27_00815 [Patescibacteria group bacterium]|jgi:hypothetical protein